MPKRKRRPSAEAAAGLPRRQVAGVLFAGLVLAAAASIALFVLYRQAQTALDRETGQRLQTVASTAAAIVPGDSLLVWTLAEDSPLPVRALRRSLRRVEFDNDLSRILLYYRDRSVVLDTAQLVERGQPYPFLPPEVAAVQSALAGLPDYTPAQRVGDVYLKTGYAPIFDDFGEVSGFVGVQASPGTFEALRELRRTLLVLGGTTVGLVVLATLLSLAVARRLLRARAALQRAETLTTMGRMAAGIAHEIRNPLGIIKNTAQLLREDLQEANVATDLVDFIPEEVDRLNETLTGYLEFAKDAPLRRERVDLVRLVRRTLKLMRPDFEVSSVQALDNCDQVGQLQVHADPRRLQQVLLNLLLNAIQAMPHGGSVWIEIHARVTEALVEIRDEGEGMEPAQVDQVFEPFFTSKEKGSGLGLSVVRRIVEDHGGRIEVRSERGRGTTFGFFLPTGEGPVRGDARG